MVQLKEHMLREVAAILCRQVESYYSYKKHNGLSGVENFILSGKEPIRVFRRIVENDIKITKVTPGRVKMEYRNSSWWYNYTFSDILIIWTKKACLQDFDWLYDSPKLGYSKTMVQKNGVEELRIETVYRCNDWYQILKAFPKLVILKLTAENFALMLSIASTELACLKEVALIDNSFSSAFIDAHEVGSLQEVVLQFDYGAYEFHVAHMALSKHQKKLLSLDTIHYANMWLDEIVFPDDAENVLSIKHLKINAKVNCCASFDYSFLPAAQKMFPSLESVEIDASVHCSCNCNEHKTPKLELVELFYDAFESLSFGCSIKVTYADTFSCFEKDLAELRQFFATKGNVYGSPRRFAVETSVPGKRLTYEATVTILPDLESFSDAEDDYGDEDDDLYNKF